MDASPSVEIGAAGAAVAAAPLRWVAVVLVFCAGILAFADRQIIAVLKPVLEHDLGWTDGEYAGVINAFQLATAVCLIPAGWFLDKVGVRLGYPLGVGAWSLAAAAHGLARTLGQFSLARAALGAAETLQSPGALKTVATQFPLSERSMAMGIINTAPNIGNIVAPLTVPALALALGWRDAFVITGAAGAVWVVAWSLAARFMPRPAAVAAAPDHAPFSAWGAILTDRRTLAIAGAKLISDQSWWFLLFWAPDFFHRRYGLGIGEIGGPLALVYGLAAAGSFGGGWATTHLLRRGLKLGVARKRVLAGASVVVLPILLAQGAPSAWAAAVVLGVALAGHQAFSTNVFATAADIFEPGVIGRAMGVASTAGTLGGMGILSVAGWMLGRHFTYAPLFAACTLSYPLALAWIHLMLPVIRPAGEAA